VSSTQGQVGLRLGFSENFRFRLGLGFCSTGLGWVSVFIFQKTRFSVGFWVFSKLKKKWNFSGKIVMKEEKNLRKSFNSSKLIAKHWAAIAGKT
jgi:hypothetical protein